MGRKKRTLTPEDQSIWEHVAKTATPMHAERRSRFAPVSETSSNPVQPRTKAAASKPIQGFQIGEKASVKHGAVMSSPTVSERVAQAPVRMDHGQYKKMLRGKMKPEGRLDLHGMTLAEAHPRLTGFILDAYDAQKRLVLVITGKGKDRDDGDPIPIRRGVLRHQVPNWLHAPPLGALVLDVREAHRRHGGGGAYYVYLKRRR